jgi:protocatechuate 3,4-dioxygenase beta subunit
MTDPALGVPLTVKLRLVSSNSGRPRTGCTVSLWHCAGHGTRSRQPVDPAGWVAFSGAFPGAHAGHWPHVHFEVHSDSDSGLLHSAQLALPQDACAKACRPDERRRLGTMTIARDDCFTEGWALEIPSVTGDAARGLVATRTVGV